MVKCETGAITCLNNIRDQIDSKRVLIFGLRSLVEYLSLRGRGFGQFSDNVLGCIDNGMTQLLIELQKRYGDSDEDILLHLIKIVASMTKTFSGEQGSHAPEIVQRALDEGYEKLQCDLLSSICAKIALSDTQFWSVVYDPLLVSLQPLSQNTNAGRILKLLPEEAVTNLEAKLRKEKKIQKPALGSAALLAHVKPSAAGAPMAHILLLTLQRQVLTTQSGTLDIPFISDILTTVLFLLEKTSTGDATSEEAVDAVLKIMETTRERKGLQETLSRILNHLVGPDQMDQYTADLTRGSGENDKASLKSLKILSALGGRGSSQKGGSQADAKMMESVTKIVSSFKDPDDSMQIESLRSALAIMEQLLNNSLADSKSSSQPLQQDLIRILSIETLTDAAILEALASILCSFGVSGNYEPDFYDSLTRLLTAKDPAPSADLVKTLAKLIAQHSAHPELVAKMRSANVLQACADHLKHCDTIGSVCRVLQNLMDAPEALEAVDAVAATIKRMRHEDRASFELCVPYLQKISEMSVSDSKIAEKLASADLVGGVLRTSIQFADLPHIVRACESILRLIAKDADIDKSVQTLLKLSAKDVKANAKALEEVCATIHGVASLGDGSAESAKIDSNTLDGLIKSLASISSAPCFKEQKKLIMDVLACIRKVAPVVGQGKPLKDEPHRLLVIAHSAGVRAIADQESSSGSGSSSGSIATDIVKCANVILDLDHFDSQSCYEKCVADISTLMRKYPEQRKTQVACLECLSRLVSSSSFDVTQEFLKSGLCKQLLGTMSRGRAIQEYQAVGLKIILAVARKRSENPDGLRRAGVVDILKLIAEHYQAKPDILKLCQQAQAILMPQEQVRDEVLSQIESLQVAGKYRDVKSGAEALTALAGLTAAADAAKYASKNGMGNAMNTFFDALKASPQVPFSELETCSLGAVQTIRNVGNVGKPHSTLLLKGGALPLIQTILKDALASDGDLSAEVVSHCLEAGRSLLANETNVQAAVGAKEFSSYLKELLPTLVSGGDPRVVMGVISAFGVMAGAEDLKADSAFVKSLPKLVEVLTNAKCEEERVEALRCIYQMIGPNSSELIERFAECGGCECVIRCLDTYGSDEMKTAVWCRKVIERIGDNPSALRTAMLKGGEKSIDYAVKALNRNLGNGNDCGVIKMLCKLTAGRTNAGGAYDLSVLEAITQSGMDLDSQSGDMKYMIGDLLTNLGGDAMLDNYFQQIIKICETTGNVPELQSILQKLELLIFCTPEDLEKGFGSAPKAMTCLANLLGRSGHSDFDVDISKFMINMSTRFKEDALSPYGVQSCIQSGYVNKAMLFTKDMVKTLPLTTKKAAAEAGGDSMNETNRTRFIINLYDTLVLSCCNEATYPTIYNIVYEKRFLDATWALLYRYKTHQEVATSIMGFLGHFTRSEEAAAHLEETRQKFADEYNVRELGEGDASTAIWNMVWNLRRNNQAVGTGLDALGMITRYNKKAKILENTAELKGKIHQLANQSAEASCGFAGFACCLLSGEPTAEQSELFSDILEVLVKQYYQIKDDSSVESAVRDRLLRRMADVVQSFARRGDYHLIRRAKVLQCLTDAAGSEIKPSQALQSLLKAAHVCREDKQSWQAINGIVMPMIAGNPLLHENTLDDIGNCERMIDTLLHLCVNDEDSKRALQEIPELLTLVTAIEASARAAPDAAQLHINAQKLREILGNKVNEKLTLETIFKRWQCRVLRHNGNDENSGYDILSMGSSAPPELLSELEFVIRETRELATQAQKAVASSPVAREFWFGCHCLALLHKSPLNGKILTTGVRGTKLQEWTLQALEFQPAEESLQAVCHAIMDGVAKASSDYAAQNNSAQIVIEALRRGTNYSACQEGINSWNIAKLPHLELTAEQEENVSASTMTAEFWLIQRLHLTAYMCQNNRQYYNSTDALDVLKYIISLVESEQHAYGIETIKAVLKVLRGMANEHICDRFIELKLPEYLMSLVDSPTSTHDLLADDLMVIGFMASFLKTKNYFGRIEGVQRIVQLLKRAEKEKPTTATTQLALSRVQQNACLAVGNLVLGHPQNATTFGREGGVDLAVKIMNNAMARKVDYDLANAVCVLISNASFKRDDFKEAFGNAGACTEILQCIKRYDGADCPAAHRCLSSMFKAVGNLALIPNNVQRFLDADIGKCLKTFYSQDQQSAGRAAIPDDLLLVSLKTLSNLTLENAEAFMLHFGAILKPLIGLISSGKHNSPELMAFVCDTFSSLCRNPENREVFINNEGILKTIELVNQFRDECVYTKALDLFAVLASYPNAGAIMADKGIFTFILGVLEDCEALDALTIVSALRVIRRLVTDKSVATKFIAAAPMPLFCECMKAATPYADRSVPCSLTVKEICHIILILLSSKPPDFSDNSVDHTQPINPREVSWSDEILTGHTTLVAKQFSRIFSKRAKSSTESASSEDEENSLAASDDPDTSAASTDMQSASSANAADENASGEHEDEAGSPVDLHTPLQAKESSIDSQLPHPVTEVVYKPKGERSYQKIGLDARNLIMMCRALFLMFATGANDSSEDSTLRQDKLSEYGLMFLTYAVVEKVDGCGLIFCDSSTAAATAHAPGCNDSSILMEKIFAKTKELKTPAKFRQVSLGADFFGNGCCVMDVSDLKGIPVNESALTSLKTSSAALTRSYQIVVRRKIEDIYALFETRLVLPDGLKNSNFYELASYDLPLDLKELSTEEFANGVQDLPVKIRGKIRRGGKNKCVLRDETGKWVVKPLWWKSSSDMLAIKFMTDKDSQNYDSQILLGRARRILRGVADPDLKEQLKILKIKSRNVVTICGGDTPSVHMIFSNRITASRMYERIATWHAAATR